MRTFFPSIPTNDLPARTDRGTPSNATKGELPQFPGVRFEDHGIDFDDGVATEDDAAIRASLIYFKHRFPGKTAVIEGSYAFRLRAWAIADEVGLPVKGPRPGSGTLVTR